MECQHILVCRLTKPPMKAVKQGMCGFVGNDVVRNGGEYHAARKHATRITCGCFKITQQKGFSIGTIEGVFCSQRMWVDAQTLHISRFLETPIGVNNALWRP